MASDILGAFIDISEDYCACVMLSVLLIGFFIYHILLYSFGYILYHFMCILIVMYFYYYVMCFLLA
jgi:hypothetical protein